MGGLPQVSSMLLPPTPGAVALLAIITPAAEGKGACPQHSGGDRGADSIQLSQRLSRSLVQQKGEPDHLLQSYCAGLCLAALQLARSSSLGLLAHWEATLRAGAGWRERALCVAVWVYFRGAFRLADGLDHLPILFALCTYEVLLKQGEKSMKIKPQEAEIYFDVTNLCVCHNLLESTAGVIGFGNNGNSEGVQVSHCTKSGRSLFCCLGYQLRAMQVFSIDDVRMDSDRSVFPKKIIYKYADFFDLFLFICKC